MFTEVVYTSQPVVSTLSGQEEGCISIYGFDVARVITSYPLTDAVDKL